jgi:hypothetical protein
MMARRASDRQRDYRGAERTADLLVELTARRRKDLWRRQ